MHIMWSHSNGVHIYSNDVITSYAGRVEQQQLRFDPNQFPIDCASTFKAAATAAAACN